MPTARIDMAKGKSAEYRAKVAHIVYRGIVEQLEAPENDNYVVVHEHEPENFFWPKNFLKLDHTPDIIFIQVVTTVGAKVENKLAFFKKMAEELKEQVGLRREDTMINMIYIKKEDWSFGNGEPWI
jgi:phenylpyruvate tautomerase PptA (4-oxalocrotonate tautomerase family)